MIQKSCLLQREKSLYDEIHGESGCRGSRYGKSPARIDEINILQATYEAMREAVSEAGSGTSGFF